jgi:hypothetical protein
MRQGRPHALIARTGRAWRQGALCSLSGKQVIIAYGSGRDGSQSGRITRRTPGWLLVGRSAARGRIPWTGSSAHQSKESGHDTGKEPGIFRYE